MLRRLQIVLIAVFVLVLGPVGAASAAQPGFPSPFEGCKEAPMPADPIGTMQITPQTKRQADPFWDKGVSITSVYGNATSYFTYDNGCKPGAGVVPSMSTGVANWGLSVPGTASSFTGEMQRQSVYPSWLGGLEGVVTSATEAAKDSVWDEWLAVVFLVIGVLMLWATRRGRLDKTVTTGAWAIIVLTLVTYLANYPAEATKLVDDGTRTAVVAVADSFSGESSAVQPSDRAQANRELANQSRGEAGRDPQILADRARVNRALDRQWDQIYRETSYRSWLEGTFGDAESKTAKKFGPRTYKASHFSWSEWESVQSDPDGKGQKIIDRKAKEFEEVADEVKETDPVAYQYFTGNEWQHRVSQGTMAAVSALASLLFIVISTILMWIGFIIIRLAVIVSPAAGIIFLLEPMRETALGWFKKIAKWIVLAPIMLFAGLVVLRINSAVAGSDSPTVAKLAIMLLVTVAAFMLVRPVGKPLAKAGRGVGAVAKIVLGAAVTAGTAGAGAAAGAAAAMKNRRGSGGEDEQQQDDPARSDAPVALPPPPPPRSLPAGTGASQAQPAPESSDLGVVAASPAPRTRDASALPVGTTDGRGSTGRATPRPFAGQGEGEDTAGRGAMLDERYALPSAGRTVEDGTGTTGPSDAELATPRGTYRPPRPGTDLPASRRPGGYRVVGEVPPAETSGPSPSAAPAREGEGAIDPRGASWRPDPIRPPEPSEVPEPTWHPEDAPSSRSTAAPTETPTSPAPAAPRPEGASSRVMPEEEPLPEQVSEANLSYGEDGSPVYVLYRPEGSRTYRVE